jgi:hypothetical protein
MTEHSRPPRWADALLRLLLKPADRDSVSGDLLETYRETIRPALGRWRADVWYVRQLAGFAWRAAWVWGVLFAASFIGRSALDWFAPPADFVVRSIVTTYTAIAIFTCAGLWTAWRLRSIRAGAFAGLAAAAIAAVINTGVSLALLAIWHDPATLAAIRGSGGLSEAFTLPVLVMVPATICATAGALIGKGLASAMDAART